MESEWADRQVCVMMCEECVKRVVKKEGNDRMYAGCWIIAQGCRVVLLLCSLELIGCKSLKECIFCLNKVMLMSQFT